MSKFKNGKSFAAKVLSLFLAVSMQLTAGASAFAADNNGYKDGLYEGTARGYKSDITVQVKIQDGKIAEVTEVSQNETSRYWKRAKALFETIVEKQSADVDGVSNATYSSNGIKNAVAAALEKALAEDKPFSGGTGTKTDPYLISSADQFSNFADTVDDGETFEGKYVALSQDIDLSNVSNWNPIGDEGKSASNVFKGSFNGNGHTVSDLKISGDYTVETNVGLFSALGETASVEQVNLSDVSISVKGSDVIRAGAVSGDIPLGNAEHMPVIDSCSAEGDVEVVVSGNKLAFAGGIAGRMQANTALTNSWTDVNVSCRTGNSSAYAAGIVGMSGNNTVVANCAAFGTSYASSPLNTNFGGLAGGISAMFAGKLWNVYAAGNSTIGNGGNKHTWVGALAGEITTSGMTKDGNNYVYPATGALRDFGYYPNDLVLTEETWNSETELAKSETVDLAATGVGTISYDSVFKGTALNRDDMSDDSFAETLNGNLKSVNNLLTAYGIDGLSLRNWIVKDGRVLPNGDVWEEQTPDDNIFADGTGTQEDPYLIKTADQLRAFAASLNDELDYSGSYIKLAADIDISGADWKPIGGSEAAFNGTFDGDGYTISGLTEGRESEPLQLDENNIYIGLFGILNSNAVLRNVNLTDVYMNISYDSSEFVGGLAGYMQGAVVDSCSVKGKIKVTSKEHNAFTAGLVSYQYKGAIINSMSDVDLNCTITSGDGLAEVGGLVALNNRGLVANCYTLGNIYGSASRNNGDEGMATISSLIAVNAGSLVNCYGAGTHTTGEFSTYVGAASGWVTGIGKTYNCWFNGEAAMKLGSQIVDPVESVGTKVASGVSEDGLTYTGGVVDKLTAYTSSNYASVAEGLNASFAKFPIDISVYGLEPNALRTWTVKDGIVTLSDQAANVTYEKPEAENVPVIPQVMRDGTWYGRDDSKTAVVSITVEDNKIVKTESINGEASGDAYEAAVEKAQEKSVYGDTSDYNAIDPSRFAGGEGTKENPYLISNESQLRYLAEALNEDVTFDGLCFRQTKDIQIKNGDWLPIGWGIMTEIKNKGTQYCLYPFLGSYDGDGYTISGLNIGTKAKASEDPRVSYVAGLFGIVSGENYTNSSPEDYMRISSLKNINLKDLTVNVSSRYQNYVGGLVGNAQNGFEIDNCSVSGFVSSRSEESFARAGGLAANVLRGVITNSSANVEVNGSTDAGQAYVGGFFGMDNRVTTVNSYSIGNVSADAGNNNKIHLGGFCGMAGGAKYNCYALGDVTANKTTTDVGGINGRLAGIAVDVKCYFNTDAKQEIAGNVLENKVATGVVVLGDEADQTEGKTAAELGSEEFAAQLNDNRANVTNGIADVKSVVDSCSMPYALLYNGDGSDLREWTLVDGLAGFSTGALQGKVYYQKKTTVTPMLRFIAEVDLADVQKAESGNYNITVNNAVINEKITKLYRSFYANGKLITASEGKVYIITSQVVSVTSGDNITVDFNFSNYNKGLSKTIAF